MKILYHLSLLIIAHAIATSALQPTAVPRTDEPKVEAAASPSLDQPNVIITGVIQLVFATIIFES